MGVFLTNDVAAPRARELTAADGRAADASALPSPLARQARSWSVHRAGTATKLGFRSTCTSQDDAGGYTETKLVASDGGEGDQLGWSVAITAAGDIIAGASFDDGNAPDSGSVYVFTPQPSGRYGQTRLTAADGGYTDGFGAAVAVVADPGRLIAATMAGPWLAPRILSYPVSLAAPTMEGNRRSRTRWAMARHVLSGN